MANTAAYAAFSAAAPLAPWTLDRRAPTARDVAIEILYCGVCHSDLHAARGDWRGIQYPFVPGHEIVGRVTAVGSQVTQHKQGDVVGVGCLVDSCLHCDSCAEGLEQHCENGAVGTYNGKDKHSGGVTYGGYSTQIVVDEHFVLKIPAGMDLAAAAPLLCAGITTYSPLRRWNVQAGMTVGVVGLGGLGHMAIKLAHAMGARVLLFTTRASKAEDGQRLGADEVVVSTDAAQMKSARRRCDVIIDTVAAPHDLDPYVNALKRSGTLVLIGIPDQPHPGFNVGNIVFHRRNISGSQIGGIAETQEMLDFCAAHNITADIEMIAMQDINSAYARMLKSDVRYRFVIDMATLRQ
ncbi:NAD(P)-dependent alcohol dehydrogenase [Sinimarinibacterium sp. NLF-5-8]|uniref:NAD(P)-dependent alcohol dehydrogenase n=1 Tax=Sinimarinibacterium sp. NLF-5-8 TaxID=2698684 RepID=UPI00137BA72F|nr:NAD(P)-dependent alcohol dehydrogenase [Sinimarinibacterium sp. NLF-5-8]QHS11062.1 NAD(P)-dependent alcohol dehydrogenase [Sinimarinibacterium sp. NLF-5-8]